mmetsp:Transcript_34042/g.54615  ORF Transcript_34042/g.54615 Transcript_34042/m.54615 type:complete len:263 (-) Transcript_34042:310-1098(-)
MRRVMISPSSSMRSVEAYNRRGLVGHRTMNATLGPMALVVRCVRRPSAPLRCRTWTPLLVQSPAAGVCARSSGWSYAPTSTMLSSGCGGLACCASTAAGMRVNSFVWPNASSNRMLSSGNPPRLACAPPPIPKVFACDAFDFSDYPSHAFQKIFCGAPNRNPRPRRVFCCARKERTKTYQSVCHRCVSVGCRGGKALACGCGARLPTGKWGRGTRFGAVSGFFCALKDFAPESCISGEPRGIEGVCARTECSRSVASSRANV